MINSRMVKKFLKQFDKGVRVRSIVGKRKGVSVTHYIEGRGELAHCHLLRIVSLRVIYGDDFGINEDAVAGNIREKCLALSPDQWGEVIEVWGSIA